jgi:hypothetical protein
LITTAPATAAAGNASGDCENRHLLGDISKPTSLLGIGSAFRPLPTRSDVAASFNPCFGNEVDADFLFLPALAYATIQETRRIVRPVLVASSAQ